MGLVAIAAIVALYFRATDKGAWAFWATAMGLFASVMTAMHGMYDAIRYEPLRNVWDSGVTDYQVVLQTLSYIPSPVDPRGIGSLFLMGMFALIMGLAITRGGSVPAVVGQVAVVWGIALLLLFVTGLFDAFDQIPYLRTGLGAIAFGIFGPVWWLLAGRELLQGGGAE
jgi:hypothetical protein